MKPALRPDAKNLTLGSTLRHIVRLTMPMALGIFSIMAMYLVDTFFIAQLGKEPLAAMGFVFPLINVLNALAFGVGAGSASLIARAIGAGQWEIVRFYTSHALMLTLLIAVIFACLCLGNIDAIFSVMGASDELLPLIKAYVQIWLLGCFLIVVPMVGNSAIRAAGDTRLPGLVMLSVAVVNMILDPILIFGWFGFPRMELQGAAVATLVAYSISFILALYLLKFRLKLIDLSCMFKGCFASWQAICRLSIPVTATNLIAPISSALTLWLVSGFGTAALAGLNIAMRIETFALIPIMAVASVMGPFSGQNFGAGEMGRVKSGMDIGYIFVSIWGLCMMLIFWQWSTELLGLFSKDKSVIDAAASYFIWVPAGYLFMGLTMITSTSFTAMGLPLYGLLLILCRLLVFFLPAAFIFRSFWGLNGVYIAILFASLFAGLLAWCLKVKAMPSQA